MGPDVGLRGARRRPHGGHRTGSGWTRITPDRSPPRGRIRQPRWPRPPGIAAAHAPAPTRDRPVRSSTRERPAPGGTGRRRRRNSQRNAGVASAERLLIGLYAPADQPERRSSLPASSVKLNAVAAAPKPLTASFEGLPAEHAGQGSFSFRVAFSEGIDQLHDGARRVVHGDGRATIAAPPESNTAATGMPTIGGTVQVGEAVSTSGSSGMEGPIRARAGWRRPRRA